MRNAKFGKLKVGDCFFADGAYFVKTERHWEGIERNAICLRKPKEYFSTLWTFWPNDLVKKVKFCGFITQGTK